MSEPKHGKQKKSGLLKKSKPVFLAFAKIRKPHALKGEVSVEILSDFPDYYKKNSTVYIGENFEEAVIRSIRKTGNTYLVAFENHLSRDDVEHMRNTLIYIHEDSLPALADNEYFHHDLIGMRCISTTDEPVGKITEVITTGANDVYVVTPEEKGKKDVLLPAIDSVIKQIDGERKQVIVELPEWL